MKAAFYAVRRGRRSGIFRTWKECEQQVKGYSGASFKKFPSESLAHDFLRGIVQELTPAVKETKPKRPKVRKIIPTPPPGTRIVWTDGACSSNGTEEAQAGVGVYFGLEDPRNVSEPLEGAQTNQRAELMAAVRALEVLVEQQQTGNPVQIRTDSRYVQRGLQEWLPGWKARGWKTTSKTPVLHRDLWERLDALRVQFSTVELVHVRGHSGDPGNEGADRLAVAGCSATSTRDI